MSKYVYMAFKTKLDANNVQANYFARACGVARFAYNWGLEEWGKQYQEHLQDKTKPLPNEASLRKQLNAIKKTEFPFMLEVTKYAVQFGIQQLGKAFDNFFSNPQHFQYPKKRKKYVKDSFSIGNDQFQLNKKQNKIKIPKLGWVKMTETFNTNNTVKFDKFISATISRRADYWYLSICYRCVKTSTLNPNQDKVVGVDLGVSALATLSTGEKIVGAKPLKHLLTKLRKLSRNLSRKQKGSNNWRKAKTKLARLHLKISNIRKNCLHKLTSYLAKNFNHVVIEDLNVKGMMKNHKLSRSIADMGFFEFKRQLIYKLELYNGQLTIVDRWFPSSKLCSTSGCDFKADKMPLSVREWTCPQCKTKHDRDVNAAINLAKSR